MVSAVRLIRSAELGAAPYAYAAAVDPGTRLLFLAGACPLEPDGTVAAAAVGDYAAQAARCIDTLTTALAAAGAGGGLADVVRTRILVASADREDLVAVWHVVSAAFGEHDVPSTLMGVTVLGYEHQLVEIEAVAAVRD